MRGKGKHLFPWPSVALAGLLCKCPEAAFGMGSGSDCPSQEEEQMGTKAQGDELVSAPEPGGDGRHQVCERCK